MHIRPATDADRPAIAALHLKSWQSAYQEALGAAFLKDRAPGFLDHYWQEKTVTDDDLLLVAQGPSGISGFVAVWCQPDPFLDNLHVDPDARSQGLGSQLLQAAFSGLRQAGHSTAYLWVFENNPRAQEFYQRQGGRIVERQLKDVFGRDVPSLRIEWASLGAKPSA